MKPIRIVVGELSLRAELNESPTARQIWEALPVESTVQTWGDEVYFEIPVVADREADARADVAVGEMGYWPLGRALCIFFGPTPASTGDAPRAYSPVNVVGRVLDDATRLRSVREEAKVRVERAVSPE